MDALLCSGTMFHLMNGTHDSQLTAPKERCRCVLGFPLRFAARRNEDHPSPGSIMSQTTPIAVAPSRAAPDSPSSSPGKDSGTTKEDSGTTKEDSATTKGNLGTTTNSRTTTRRRKTQERRRKTLANDMPRENKQARTHARTEGHRNNLPVSLAFRRYPAHGGRYRAGDHRATEAPLATSNNTRAYDPLHVNCFLNRSQPNPATRLLALSCRRFAALFSSVVHAGDCALPCLGFR